MVQAAPNFDPMDNHVDFDKIIPLQPRVKDIAFPVGCLPEPFSTMVAAIAEAYQVDPAMPAVTVLSVLAAAAGGAVEAQITSDWVEPLVLFTATVAAPGERKSGVQAALLGPLIAAEETLAESSRGQRLEDETTLAIATQVAEQARKVAAKDAKSSTLAAEAISAAMAAESIQPTTITRLIADDITPEAAATLMAEQQRLAIISAEGGVFDTIAGRYNQNIPNLDLFLKGHAGDALRIDRKGRPPEYVKRPALTVGLMIQPAVLEAIGRNRPFRGRGLLARFLYATPRSLVGVRNASPTPVPETIKVQYHERLYALATELHGWVGDPAKLLLSDGAKDDVVAILKATEPELGPGGRLVELADWGSKYVGAVCRIAGLLHLAEHGPGGARLPVERETILQAVTIGNYFKAHAIRAFSTMNTDPAVNDMGYVMDQVKATGQTELTERDIYNAARSRFPQVADLRPVLINLCDRGHLAQLPETESNRPGRKPSPRFAVNPDA